MTNDEWGREPANLRRLFVTRHSSLEMVVPEEEIRTVEVRVLKEIPPELLPAPLVESDIMLEPWVLQS